MNTLRSLHHDGEAIASTLPQEGFIRLPKVLDVMGISKSTWYLGIKQGIYPRWVKISKGASGWDVADIRKCMAERKRQQHATN